MLCYKISYLDDRIEKEKDEILKTLESIESALKLSHEWLVSAIIERAIKKIWDLMKDAGVTKKVILM